MCADLNSELSKITDKYLEHVKKSSGIKIAHFDQLVNDLLDHTSDYMNRNNIHDTAKCVEIVQSELERFIHATSED